MRIWVNRRSVRARPYERSAPDQLLFQSAGPDTRIILEKKSSDDRKPTIHFQCERADHRNHAHRPEVCLVSLSWDEVRRLRRVLLQHTQGIKGKRLPPRSFVRTRTPWAKKR